MQKPNFLTSFIILLLVPWTGHASELWGVCEACSDNTAGFASGLAPERFGQHTVNVYDAQTDELSSFLVTVYYDFEFSAWTRFALPVATSSDAVRLLHDTQDAVLFLQTLPEHIATTVVEVDRVQDFIGSAGAMDHLISNELFHSMNVNGLGTRFLNSLVQVASTIGRLISNNYKPRFRIHFLDGSSIEVTATIIANALNDLSIEIVPGTARLPDGTILPHDGASFDGYFAFTDSVDNLTTLANWAILVGGYRIRGLSVVQPGRQFTYVFRCNADSSECTITAVGDR